METIDAIFTLLDLGIEKNKKENDCNVQVPCSFSILLFPPIV